MTDRVRIARTLEVHRVAQPAWIQAGVVSAQAFAPRPRDKGELSLFDKGQDAEAAVASWRAAFPQNAATKCLTLAVGAYDDLAIPVYEQPTDRFPTHAVADFNGLGSDDAEVASVLLAEACEVGP